MKKYIEKTQEEIDVFMKEMDYYNSLFYELLKNKIDITREKWRWYYEEECKRIADKTEAIILNFKKHK